MTIPKASNLGYDELIMEWASGRQQRRPVGGLCCPFSRKSRKTLAPTTHPENDSQY